MEKGGKGAPRVQSVRYVQVFPGFLKGGITNGSYGIIANTTEEIIESD